MNAHVNADLAHLATTPFADFRATASTPERDFIFDLEGPLYEMEALSTTLEALLIDTINEMRSYDRGRAAAIDFAASTLRQRIVDLARSYDDLGQKEESDTAETSAA